MSSDVDRAVSQVRSAQAQFAEFSQEQVDKVIGAMHQACMTNLEKWARMAHEETGYGLVADKVAKNRFGADDVYRYIRPMKTVGFISADPARGIYEVASPMGLVAAVIPSTNPTSTAIYKVLISLKSRNGIVLSPHPSAKNCIKAVADAMHDAAVAAGAPRGIIACLAAPSIADTQALMKHPGTNVILATGGMGLVNAAYSSGKPAYGVGAGNSTVVVDETADLKDAATKIRNGKIFDNATSCSSENSVVLQASIYDTMMKYFQELGGHLCSPEEKTRLRNLMWPDGAHMGRDHVGQHAQKIAALAGIKVAPDVSFLMVLGEAVGPADMFSGEKLSPVLTVWKYGEFEEAIRLVRDITRYSGYGHSCGIHTTNDAHMVELATRARVSRVMVRQTQPFGNSGNYDNGMPFGLTLGCGTWGGNIVSENVHWKHFLNTTWVSMPIAPVVPDENKIFGQHWKKYGR